MVEHYLIDDLQHDALIRAARYGKTCRVLSEFERTMCDCAEQELNDITKVFTSKLNAIVTFDFAEHQIPALEKAWGLLRQEHSMDKKWNLIVDGKFPDFEKFTPSDILGLKVLKQNEGDIKANEHTAITDVSNE
jgi:hypothetical protein